MKPDQSVDQILARVRRDIKSPYERDYFDLHRGRYRFILNKVIGLSIASNASILDVGCYPPHLMTALQHLGYSVSGIASPHEPIRSSNVTVLNIETDSLSFRPRSFDVVLFSEVIEHLVVNPGVYLSKFHRVLAPHGTLLVTTPNAAGLHKLIPILLGKSTYFPLEQLFATSYDDGSLYHRHNREFTLDELTRVLDMTGFTVERTEFVSAYKHQSLKRVTGNPLRAIARFAAYLLTDPFPTRRDTLYVEASPK